MRPITTALSISALAAGILVSADKYPNSFAPGNIRIAYMMMSVTLLISSYCMCRVHPCKKQHLLLWWITLATRLQLYQCNQRLLFA